MRTIPRKVFQRSHRAAILFPLLMCLCTAWDWIGLQMIWTESLDKKRVQNKKNLTHTFLWIASSMYVLLQPCALAANAGPGPAQYQLPTLIGTSPSYSIGSRPKQPVILKSPGPKYAIAQGVYCTGSSHNQGQTFGIRPNPFRQSQAPSPGTSSSLSFLIRANTCMFVQRRTWYTVWVQVLILSSWPQYYTPQRQQSV